MKENAVLVIRGKEDVPRYVYYNDPSLNVKISPAFIEQWSQVALPLEIDISRELEKAGLKSMEVIDMKSNNLQAANSKKGKTKRKSRFKLTNTHLEGVDLTKEFNPNNN